MILVENPSRRRRKRRTPPRTKSGKFRKRRSGGSRKRKRKATRRRRYSKPKATRRRKRKSNPRLLTGLFGRGQHSLAGAAMNGVAMYAGGWLQNFFLAVVRSRIPQTSALPEWVQQAGAAYLGGWLLRQRFVPRFLRQFAKPFVDVGMYKAAWSLAFQFNVPTASSVAQRIGLADWLTYSSPQLNGMDAYISRGSEAGLAPVHHLGFYGDDYNEYGEAG